MTGGCAEPHCIPDCGPISRHHAPCPSWRPPPVLGDCWTALACWTAVSAVAAPALGGGMFTATRPWKLAAHQVHPSNPCRRRWLCPHSSPAAWAGSWRVRALGVGQSQGRAVGCWLCPCTFVVGHDPAHGAHPYLLCPCGPCASPASLLTAPIRQVPGAPDAGIARGGAHAGGAHVGRIR